MAKFDKKKSGLDYGAEIKKLKDNGAQRLYLLCGEEDYLREMYLAQLKVLWLGGLEDGFSYKRLDGPAVNLSELDEAVNSLPFLNEHTLVEVRGFDINSCREKEAARLVSILSDIPGFCTVVFVFGPEYSIDGRLSCIRSVKKLAVSLEFTAQDQTRLAGWISKRFAALGKSISHDSAQYLIFISGSLMSRLIPEIEKAAAFAQGSEVTREDIARTAQRIPEADVFEMTELIGAGRFDEAARLLADLLHTRQHPIALLALIGQQLRRLYAVKLAKEKGLGRDEMMALCGVSYGFIADKLSAAAGNYSLAALERNVALCAEYDHRMKSGGDPEELIKELIARIAGGV